MMVSNTIKENRARLNLTQAQLANMLDTDDHTSLTLSVIESGKALPTKPYLDALCGALDRDALELYRPEDLDLMGLIQKIDADDARISPASASDRKHSGLVEFRTWLKPHEKENIERAVFYLGYRSMAEWFREAYRNLIQREMRVRNTTKADA